MRYEVRPLSFGEILDQAFKVFKDQFVLMLSITAPLYVPYAFVQSLMNKGKEVGVPKPPSFDTLGPVLLVAAILLMVAPLTQLAASRAASEAYLNQAPTVGEAYRAGLKLYGRYAVTCLLVGLGMMGAAFLLFLPAVYFGVCWTMVGPIAVVEGVFGRAAMKRSRALVRGMWWRTLGVLFVVGMLSALVSGGVSAVVSSIPLVGPVCAGVVQSITAAFGSIALMVLYVDLRCRAEDFDLQLMARAVTTAAGPGAAAARAVET